MHSMQYTTQHFLCRYGETLTYIINFDEYHQHTHTPLALTTPIAVDSPADPVQ